MIKIRFIDPTTNVVISDAVPTSCSIKFTLSQSPEWSASFVKNLAAIENVNQGANVEIYFNEVNILTGKLQSPSEKWGGQKVDISLSGRGVMDNLYDVRSYSYGYFENRPRLGIVAELLERAGWRVGHIETWTNAGNITTVDLRNEKRLYSQIASLINSFPATYFRYGGIVAGKHTIDIGSFNTDSGVALVRGAELETTAEMALKTGLVESINQSTTLTEIVNAVEVWGGDVQDNLGVERTIFLKDTLAGYPALASDPDFPIITELANALYRIQNNALATTRGSQSTERYPQYAPEKTNANATVLAIQTAALALYERGVAFLKDHQDNIDKISIKSRGNDLLMDVGDKVYVSATARQAIIDPFSDQVIDVLESNIQDSYRCTSLSVSFDNDTASWSFELTNGNLVQQEDIFVSVYDASVNKPQVTGTVTIAGYNAPTLVGYNVSVNGGYPDTTLSDGTPARLLTIPVPVTGLPVWTPTKVYSASIPIATGTSYPIKVEVVQDFAYPSTPMILKLGVKNSGWSDAISLLLYYSVMWSQ